MPIRPVKRDLGTAFHEAGHAVSAIGLGLEVEHVGIARGGHSGLTMYARRFTVDVSDGRAAPELTPWEERLLRSRAVSIACGPEAERRFGRPAGVGAGSDRRHIAEILKGLGYAGEEIGLSMRILASQARRLVDGDWHAITAVALALFERYELRGREVRAIAADPDIAISSETARQFGYSQLSVDGLLSRPRPCRLYVLKPHPPEPGQHQRRLEDVAPGSA
jgi:hypothetical protein